MAQRELTRPTVISQEKIALFHLESEIQAASAILERDLIADYGRYSEDHSVFQYVQALLKDSVPRSEYSKLRLVVTHGWEEPNACVLPTGTIIVSDRLLEYCEYKEELQWVLRHEWKHIQREHVRRQDTSPRRATIREQYKKIAQQFGRNRLQEYEADLRARTDDHDAVEVNPYGGIRLTERLVQSERLTKASGSIVHGSSMDRLLNLHFVNRILDTKSLQHELTLIPHEAVHALQKTRSFTHLVLGDEHEQRNNAGAYMARSLAAMRDASPEQVGIIIRPLFERYKEDKRKDAAHTTDSSRYYLDHTTELLKFAIPKLKKEIDRTLKHISTCERPVPRGLIAALVYGVPIEDALDTDSPASHFADFFDSLEESEDFTNLSQQFEVLHQMGVICRADPLPLIRRVCAEANASGMFNDTLNQGNVAEFITYTQRVVDAAFALYPEGELRREQVLLLLIPEALTSVPKKLLPKSITEIAAHLHASVDTVRKIAEMEYQIIVDQENFHLFRAEEADKNLGTLPFITRLIQKANDIASTMPKWSIADVVQKDIFKEESKEKKILLELKKDIRLELRKQPWTTPQQAIDGVRTYINSISDIHAQSIVVQMIIKDLSLVLNAKTLPPTCRREEVLRYSMMMINALPEVHGVDKRTGLLEFLFYVDDSTELSSMQGDDMNDLERVDFSHASQWRHEWMPHEDDVSIVELQEYIDSLRLSGIEIVDTAAQIEFDQHSKEMDEMYAQYYYGRMRYVLSNGSRQQFFYELQKYLMNMPDREGNIAATRLVLDVFTKYNFDFKNPAELNEMLTLTAHIKDVELGNRLQEKVVAAMFDIYNDTQLENVLFRDERTRRRLLHNVRMRYIEERLRTPEQLRRAVDEIARSRVFEDESLQAHAGEVIMVRSLIEGIQKNPVFTIESALNTEKDDTDLVEVVAQAALSVFIIEHPDDYIGDEYEAKEAPNIPSMIRRLYEMDDITKRALIRELLVGKNGVLFDQRSVRRLIKRIFERHITNAVGAQEQALRTGIQETMITAAQVVDVPTLYFMLEPFLFKNMWRRPIRETDWDKVKQSLARTHENAVAWHNPKVVEALMGALSGSVAKQTSGKIEQLQNKLLTHVHHYAPPEDKVGQQEQTSSIGFIIMTASQLGAPGVRLLQVAGQYLSMSSSMERDLSAVYDSLSGQPKLSAFMTINREWKNIDRELFNMGKTIGGASLATVWETTTENGDEVVKVLNPNAEFFVDTICSMLEKTFKAMDEIYPVQSRLGVLAVRDIREWVKADIRDTNWMSKDRDFALMHNNFTLDGVYRIRIPKIYGEESRYYKREEKIVGKNLTKIDELRAEGYDLQKIARLVCANVFYQIQKGRVHSDIHPGNIRITPEKEVVWLDRSLYVELEPAEQQFIAHFTSGERNTIELFEEYCRSLPENTTVPKGMFAELSRERGVDLSQPHGVAEMISIAKERGVHVPLKVTILVKNFLALHTLIREAGFYSFQDAMNG